MRTLNLGILAHVDAGKTSLTERLLYAAGVIDRIGRVDAGTTQTDSLALERQRGITIKAAVVSFVVDDVTMNLIDTPGHPDFIAEVERVLGVLDGAVLVLSAVEGVQPQTRLLMRTLQRLKLPTLLFVNKIDRVGAQPERVLATIAQHLTPAAVAMGSVQDPGTRGAACTPYSAADGDFEARLVDVLAEQDEALLTAYLDDPARVSYRQLRDGLVAQTRRALAYPVFFGSAITGAGVDALIAGIAELLPAEKGDAEAPLAGRVFKVERGPAGEKIAYARLFSGTLRTRDRVPAGRDQEAKVTAISVFEHGGAVQRPEVAAGRIGKLWGLGQVQIGDPLGALPRTAMQRYFPPPTLETVIAPGRAAKRAALRAALEQLAEQDPLIGLRQDDERQELYLSLYGEVQKEVIQATLATDYGLEVEFRETTPLCIERPIDTGAAFEVLREAPNPFLATVGLRIEPAPVDSGVEFRLASEVLGMMPAAFFKAVEDTVHETFHQGLHGWQVTDCTVTMTHAGYVGKHSLGHQRFNKSMSSTGEDYRHLTPLVLMSALQRAGTTVCEPLHRYQLEVPADTLGTVLRVLARLGAVPQMSTLRGASCLLEGDIPVAHVHELQQQLPALSRGEGVLEAVFDRYQPVGGTRPTRPRTDHNPLDRKEYLLHVMRRV